MDDIRIIISSSSKEFNSLNDVFDSDRVHNGDTITFLTDVTLASPVTINAKKCTIDLNGHYLFVPISGAVVVKGASNVTFINGYVQTMSADTIEDVFIVQGSKTYLTLGDKLEVSTRGTAAHARKRGNLIINGANVTVNGDQPSIYVDDAYSSMTVNKGTVASYSKNAIVVRNGASVEINGGNVHTDCSGLTPEASHAAILVNGQDSKLTINDGVVVSAKSAAIDVEDAATVEINGGDVHTTSSDYTAIEMQEGYSFLRVAGGKVYSTKTSTILSNMMDYGDIQTIIMTGGDMGAQGNIIHVAGGGDHGIVFSGGRVKGFLDPKYLAPGYVVSDLEDSDGYHQIKLKTWSDPVEKPEPAAFPNAVLDPDPDMNPFNRVVDPDNIDPPVNPFPTYQTEPILIPEEPAEVIPDIDTTEIPDIDTSCPCPCPDEDDHPDVVPPTPCPPPMPYPPEPVDPFAPPCPPYDHTIPMPIPDGVYPDIDDLPGGDSKPPKPPKPHVINNSVVIKNKIYLYKTYSLSRKYIITEWRGSLTYFMTPYISPTGEEFWMVKFRIPGSGKVQTGYALSEDIKKNL